MNTTDTSRAPQAVIPVDADDVSRATDDLPCPLCGYNLRGLMEGRCPECGFAFDREALTDPNRRWHPYLFEQHPARPTWSFFKTLTASLRPRRFWKTLRPEQHGNPKRLLLYWAIGNLALLLLVLAMVVTHFGTVTAYVYRGRQMFDSMSPTPGWPRTRIDQMRDKDYPAPPGKAFFKLCWQWFRTHRIPRATVVPVVLVLAWPWATFATLMLFRASMRRARVRTLHVLRCVIYSCDVLAWYCVIAAAAQTLSILEHVLQAARVNLPVVSSHLDFWSGVLGLALMAAPLVLWYRLGVSYHLYLRFDRPYLTALASQAIVALLMLCWIVPTGWVI